MCQPADSHPCGWIPAVHAEMTDFLYLIVPKLPAWERDLTDPAVNKRRASMHRLPRRSVTDIKLRYIKLEIGCRRNAKLQLGPAFPDAKLELGVPKQA